MTMCSLHSTDGTLTVQVLVYRAQILILQLARGMICAVIYVLYTIIS